MTIGSAFNQLLFLHSRKATITRRETSTTVTIRISPSNYYRNMAGPEEIVMKGREFVISKQSLDAVSFPAPKRGDVIVDSELGKNTLVEVREMFDFGGRIIGYRVRTG